MNEKEVLRQMADDLRAIRNVLETVFRRQEFAMILRGLRDRGIITHDDVERFENSNAEAQRRGDAGNDRGAEHRPAGADGRLTAQAEAEIKAAMEAALGSASVR